MINIIRDGREVEEYSDDQFARAIEPSENIIIRYCREKLIYDIFPFVISTLYEKHALWDNYTLENIYKQTIEHLLNDMPNYKDLDMRKLKNILERQYSIRLKNKDPIKIEKIQPY